MGPTLKNIIQRFVRLFGITIHRVNGRGTMEGALLHLKKKRFSIEYIIDGGASDGRWTRSAQKYFPKAHYMLVEPIKEHAPALRKINNAEIFEVALSRTEGVQEIYVQGDFNSTLGNESASGEKRIIKTITLDSLITEPQKTLVKLDLEGGEYDVLESSELLPKLAGIIVECAFERLPKYCSLMEEKGMAVYEIYDLNLHCKNNNMYQADIVFVPKNSPALL